jgi:hypothetical protein
LAISSSPDLLVDSWFLSNAVNILEKNIPQRYQRLLYLLLEAHLEFVVWRWRKSHSTSGSSSQCPYSAGSISIGSIAGVYVRLLCLRCFAILSFSITGRSVRSEPWRSACESSYPYFPITSNLSRWNIL